MDYQFFLEEIKEYVLKNLNWNISEENYNHQKAKWCYCHVLSGSARENIRNLRRQLLCIIYEY